MRFPDKPTDRSRHRSFGGRAVLVGFLKSLVRRGLKGVKLVISDAHEGLRLAITRVLGAGWQRCRVHWMHNALAHVPKGQPLRRQLVTAESPLHDHCGAWIAQGEPTAPPQQ